MSYPRPVSTPRALGALAQACGVDLRGSSDAVVTGITHDSRDVRPGDIFAALPGDNAHGAAFIDQARESGAVAVFTDPEGLAAQGADDLPALVAATPRAVLGLLSAEVYGHPAGGMAMLGVTGTNGKSTTVHLLAAGLASAGHTVGVIGTTGVRIGDEAMPSARTTPEAPDLHALLGVMRDRGVTAVAMEVSSHALVLGRVDGVVYDVSIFTQLSQDHLDFHGTMEDYFAAKASLFTSERTRRGVIGVDGMWGRRLADQVQIPALTYALDHDADVTCTAIVDTPRGQTLTIARDHRVHLCEVGLPARFNAANALGAWTALTDLGVPEEALTTAMAAVSVPGRMEVVDVGQDFTAIVDYAHSPDAVERALAAVEPRQGGRRIAVLGCGGDRDRDKRPLMGDVGSRGADLLIVTDDNPRSEDPSSIRTAMLEGVRVARGEVIEEGDRRAAIAMAVQAASPGDVVFILGKGHEQGQEVSGVVHPFDDRDELRRALGDAR